MQKRLDNWITFGTLELWQATHAGRVYYFIQNVRVYIRQTDQVRQVITGTLVMMKLLELLRHRQAGKTIELRYVWYYVWGDAGCGQTN